MPSRVSEYHKKLHEEAVERTWIDIQKMADGLTLIQVSKERGVAAGTIKRQLHSLYEEYDVYTHAALVAIGFRMGRIK